MTDCVFCRIVAGEIPATVIDSDEAAIAFLDIAPWHTGHTLVVPRRHVEDVTSDPTALTEIAPAISRVASLLTDRLGADGINLMSSAGSVAGQEVFHLHVHVVPRYSSAPGLANLVHRDADTDLAAVAARIAGASAATSQPAVTRQGA